MPRRSPVSSDQAVLSPPRTVPVRCAIETLECATRAGLDADALLRQSGLYRSLWASPRASLTIPEFSRLANAISIPLRD